MINSVGRKKEEGRQRRAFILYLVLSSFGLKIIHVHSFKPIELILKSLFSHMSPFPERYSLVSHRADALRFPDHLIEQTEEQ